MIASLCSHRAVLLLAIFALLPGCGSELETMYGRRSGFGATSVNGTAVLAGMFQQRGHEVISWGSLSPRVYDRADCIVWFPDDFEPPPEEVVDWLEDWLLDEPGRTLIYVGRDYDAEADYWRAVLPKVPAAEKPQVESEIAMAEASARLLRGRLSKKLQSEWFTYEPQAEAREVRSLEGKPEWLRGVNSPATEIEVRSRMVPTDEAETLLRSGDDALISEVQFDDSRLILVANGSFLLNYSLVNHEHRKLAGKLVDAIGPPKQTVMFLESGPGGPPIREEDPEANMPSGFEIFNIWPTNWILMHLVVVGILFCFSRWPIFGWPRDPETETTADFRKHVAAVGQWLSKTRDPQYARQRIEHYQKTRDDAK